MLRRFLIDKNVDFCFLRQSVVNKIDVSIFLIFLVSPFLYCKYYYCLNFAKKLSLLSSKILAWTDKPDSSFVRLFGSIFSAISSFETSKDSVRVWLRK